MERPKEFAPLPPVILGRDAQSVPRILWHQGRCNPSPRAGEGDALASGKGYLKDVQKTLNKRFKHPSFLGLSQESCVNQYLCNNKANLLTRLETRCHKILGTRPRMTGAGDACLVLVNRLPRCARNDGRARGEPVSFVLNSLFPKVSFFLQNPVKTCWTAEKAPLIRCSGFAERERDLCLAYFSSFFPLYFSCFTFLFYTSRTP